MKKKFTVHRSPFTVYGNKIISASEFSALDCSLYAFHVPEEPC